MNEVTHLLTELSEQGARMTNLRMELVRIFERYQRPFAVDELLSLFKKRAFAVHKVTMYRELQFLLKAKVIEEVHISTKRTLYEFADRGHHHHLVCTKCEAIEEVFMRHELDEYEKSIVKKTNFQILKHSLEFFGLCKRCQ